MLGDILNQVLTAVDVGSLIPAAVGAVLALVVVGLSKLVNKGLKKVKETETKLDDALVVEAVEYLVQEGILKERVLTHIKTELGVESDKPVDPNVE